MKKVLLLQLDGKIPNIALMRVSHHHKELGHEVVFRRASNITGIDRQLWDDHFDEVYASAIFTRSKYLGERVLEVYPHAHVGGTGWRVEKRLEDVGVTTLEQDYSLYPDFDKSIGFSQRGCRLKCSFCVVPKKEGAVVQEKTIHEIWRGDPWPREILLLDNDFFGQPNWRDRVQELREGNFKVSFNQGINARMITEEAAEAIGSVDYRDDGMKEKRIYTAWDNKGDEKRLFAGLEALVRHGVRPRHIMVYMLIGFWPNETEDDWEYRRRKLREFGARPYPMPYVRTPAAVGFQRFVVRQIDEAGVTWEEFTAANYHQYKLDRQRKLKKNRLWGGDDNAADDDNAGGRGQPGGHDNEAEQAGVEA